MTRISNTGSFNKFALKCAVAGACMTLGFSFVSVTAASAKDPQQPRHKHRVHRADAAIPAQRSWTGADPTRGPGMEQLRSMQRDGRCVMDEGYGRWMPCGNP